MELEPSRPLRILFICGDGIFAGLEKITIHLVKAARQSGHAILCMGSFWGSGQFTRRLLAEHIPLERSWFGFISVAPALGPLRMTLAQLLKLPVLWRDFRRVVRSWKPDVIHFTNFHHVFLIACGPTDFGVPWIFQVHNVIRRGRAVNFAFRRLERYVDRFVAVSEFVRQSLIALGVPDSKIDVVLNGVPLPVDPQRREDTWRRQYEWGREAVIVGIVGQVAHWKGHETFIEAVGLAQRNARHLKAIVVGGGQAAYLQLLRELAARCCLPGSVQFAGFCNDMDMAYRQFDIVAVASVADEAFGLSAAEAMSYAIPVVATDRGALPEVLGELHEWIVPSGDAPSLGRALERLALDRALRSATGARGRARVEAALTLDRCAAEMARVYAHVAGSPR